jgi:hypothetical protein
MGERCHDNVLGHLRQLSAEVASDEQHRLLVRLSEADVQVRVLGRRREVAEALRVERALQRCRDGSAPPGLADEGRRRQHDVAVLDRQIETAVKDREAARKLLMEQVPEFVAAMSRAP